MDKDDFVRALDERAQALYRIAYTILRNDDACMDAMQETALKAWEKRFTLREPAYFGTWITRILINTCRDACRRRRNIVSLETLPEPSAPPPDPTLAIALESLPENLRLPLMLRYSEGMSYEQIAKALRLPVSTVRGRLHNAKIKLRKELYTP